MAKDVKLVPAYGRDYKSAKAVKEDFFVGKDFRIADISSPWDGKVTSVRDFEVGDTATIRYKGLRMVVVIKVTNK